MRAEREVRREAVVVGPGRPGFVHVSLTPSRTSSGERIVEVETERIPTALRPPNTRVVAVTGPEGVLRVESGPEALERLRLEDEFRSALNEWDPIGVADAVDDEYDFYVAELIGLVGSGAGERAIADRLLRIERDRMGFGGTPLDHRLSVATRLRAIPRARP